MQSNYHAGIVKSLHMKSTISRAKGTQISEGALPVEISGPQSNSLLCGLKMPGQKTSNTKQRH